jgi:hypothetical protein
MTSESHVEDRLRRALEAVASIPVEDATVQTATVFRHGGRWHRVAAAVVVLAVTGAGIGLVISYGPRSHGTGRVAIEAPTPGPNAGNPTPGKLANPHRTNSTIPQGKQCQGSWLSAHGGRQGGGYVGVAEGTVVLTNQTTSECVLTGLPTVILLSAEGQLLDVKENAATNPVTFSVLLEPGLSAYLIVYWTNWCAPLPGPLQVEVVLPQGKGVVVGDFNIPAFVPACIRDSQPSTLEVAHAYLTSP